MVLSTDVSFLRLPLFFPHKEKEPLRQQASPEPEIKNLNITYLPALLPTGLCKTQLNLSPLNFTLQYIKRENSSSVMTKLKPSFRGPHLAACFFFSLNAAVFGALASCRRQKALHMQTKERFLLTQEGERERERKKKTNKLYDLFIYRRAESHGVCLMRRLQTSRSQSIN